MDFDISTLISDTPIVVELYLCPKATTNMKNGTIEVGWKRNQVAYMPSNTPTFTSKQHMYHYRDITYSYDLSNDAQRAIRQIHVKDACMDNNVYAISFEEEVLPCHRFPCTDEIAYETDIVRSSFRVNNRVNIIHDVELNDEKEYLYIRYQHSPNVDIQKINEDIMKTLRRLMRKK